MAPSLSQEEKNRYSRSLLLNGFGEASQLKLKESSVLVVGAGGLGCSTLLYLATAGVGKIGIADGDTVSISNLQRQILYNAEHVGLKKVEVAASVLINKNPNVDIETYPDYIDFENCIFIAKNYDVIIDASDNFETRYLLNDASLILNKPLVYAALHEFEGQISVFNYKNGPTLRCLFPEVPKSGTINNCAETGVFSILPGFIGTWQAQEAVKIITGIGEVLSGKLLIYNSLLNEIDTISITPIEENRKIDNLVHFRKHQFHEIDAFTLKAWLEEGNINLIDVREIHEFEIENIGGLNIPLVEIGERLEEINSQQRTVIICQTGKRSLTAVQLIKQQFPDLEISHLKGGLNNYLL